MATDSFEQVNQSISRLRTRSRRRFIAIGAALIIAIMGTTALFTFMQRAGAVSADETATSNLGNGMAQQTTVMLDSVDNALRMINSKIEEVPHSTPDQIKKDIRLSSTLHAAQ
jgi:hypothetical protein